MRFRETADQDLSPLALRGMIALFKVDLAPKQSLMRRSHKIALQDEGYPMADLKTASERQRALFGFDPEWLEKYSEEILEPQLPIIDAHHHLWDRG